LLIINARRLLTYICGRMSGSSDSHSVSATSRNQKGAETAAKNKSKRPKRRGGPFGKLLQLRKQRDELTKAIDQIQGLPRPVPTKATSHETSAEWAIWNNDIESEVESNSVEVQYDPQRNSDARTPDPNLTFVSLGTNNEYSVPENSYSVSEHSYSVSEHSYSVSENSISDDSTSIAPHKGKGAS
jgi:hypothetical protein